MNYGTIFLYALENETGLIYNVICINRLPELCTRGKLHFSARAECAFFIFGYKRYPFSRFYRLGCTARWDGQMRSESAACQQPGCRFRKQASATGLFSLPHESATSCGSLLPDLHPPGRRHTPDNFNFHTSVTTGALGIFFREQKSFAF